MTTNDFKFEENSVFITVAKTKTNQQRIFAISNPIWLKLIAEYYALRPAHTNHNRFFVNYKSGKCTVQPIGINKMGSMPRRIAKFLNLPNSELYSGHCFRRSSASHLANKGEDIISLKRHGGWKSSSVAESYVEASAQKKLDIAQTLASQIPASSSQNSNGCILTLQ
ncbi:uncharacterized protein LOC123680884 [Harmonia axyridis]|uniref:uncharacterized protein LOC123680884 n=1 Tax=Harmonia axyridis TaxID=115357 RepID=UPI001E27682A|nr:uncharacterized protein LOC123680884 [Harmonia axyridis]